MFYPPDKRRAVVTQILRPFSLDPRIDDTFNDQKNAPDVLPTVKERILANDDPGWNTLIDCANATRKPSERAEALRVAAMWESLRAQAFQKLYLDAQPIKATSCKNLDVLDATVKAFWDSLKKSGSDARFGPLPVFPPAKEYKEVMDALAACANESATLNQGKPPWPEEAKSKLLIRSWDLAHEINEHRILTQLYVQVDAEADDLVIRYNGLAKDYNDLLEHAQKTAAINNAYIRSLQGVMFLQSLQTPTITCGGTSYSYGTWGTFSLDPEPSVVHRFPFAVH